MKFQSVLLNLNYFLAHCKPIYDIVKDDPTLSLLRRNQEFELVLSQETNYEKYIKYIYVNRKSILAILFDEESKIDIQNIIRKNNYYIKLESFIYYLCLLIEENKDIVYFIYPADFISKIKSFYLDINNNNNNNVYSNIIFCKIIFVLINNYLAENYLNANRELKNTEKVLEENIKNDIKELKEIDLNFTFEEIITKNLEDIYCDIIISILKAEIRDKFNKAINIFTQLNLDVINILNENIFNKIKLAIKDRNFKRKYLIQNSDDFNDVNKINMYFILLKYLFKDSISIYQVPFLSDAREVLIRNLKSNKNRIFENKINNKIFVIKKLLDLDYYINKYLKEEKEEEEINMDLNNDDIEFEIKEEIKVDENKNNSIINIKELEDINEVLTYYKNYKFESKKKDIDLIETQIKTGELADFKELYLKDLDEAKKMNLRYPIINFFYLNGNNKGKPLSEKEIGKTAESFDKCEKLMVEKILNKMPVTEHKLLFEYFKNPENEELFINIFSKELYDIFIKFNKLKVVYNYYNHYFFESKKEETKIIDKLIKEKSFNNRETELYLKDYEIAEKMNLRYQIILFLSKGENKEEKENIISEKKINEIASLWNEHIEKPIKERSNNYTILPKSLQNLLLDFFKNKEKEEYLLKIFTIDEIEFFRNLDLNEIEIIIDKKEDKNEKKLIKEIIEEKKEKQEKQDIIPIPKVEINPEETALKTKILSSFEKNKGDLKTDLNNDEIVLMFELYGNENIDGINKDKISKLIDKYKAVKDAILKRKKRKLNKNVVKETCAFFSDDKNKEKMLKLFSQDDIDFLLSLNPDKNIIVKKEKETETEPEIVNKLKEVQQYYINFFKEKNKNDINAINQILQEQNKNDVRIALYIKLYDEAYEKNIRYPLIDYLFQIRLKENKAKEISEIFKPWKVIEDGIKNRRVRRLKEKNNILAFFKQEKNREILLKIFTEEQINFFLDEKNLEIKDDNIISEPNAKKEKEQTNREIIVNLKIILNYYKIFLFESKAKEITEIENAIDNDVKIEYEKYMKDLENAKKMNDRYPIIEFLHNKENKDKNSEKDYESLINSFSAIEKMIRDKKINKFRGPRKDQMLEFFSDNKNMDILLKIFTQEQIGFFLSQNKQKIPKIPKIPKEDINKLKEIQEYYINYLFETKEKEINELNEIIEKGKTDYQKYLEDYEKAKKMNIKYPLINIFIVRGGKQKTENNINECIESWDKFEGMIKNKRFKKMNAEIKRELLEYFNNKENEERLLQIFKQDEIDFFKDEKNHSNLKKKSSAKLNDETLNNLRIVLKYYQNYLFDTKKEEIIQLNKAIEKGEQFEYNKYLENVNLEELKNLNDKFPLIEFLYNKNNKSGKKTEDGIESMKNHFIDSIEKGIKENKFRRLRKDRKEQLLEFFNNNENREIALKIFTQDEIDNFISQIDSKKPDENINKLKEILEYYNNYLFVSKKEQIVELTEIIKNEKGKYEKYLEEYETAKKKNLIFPLINILLDCDKKNKTEKNLEESEKSWKVIEELINNKKLKKMHKNMRQKLFEYFNDEKNKDRLLQIFSQEIYEFFKDENNHPKPKLKEENKLSEDVLNDLRIVLKYYQNYYFESKKDEIINLDNAIKKGDEFDYKKYLENIETMKADNNKYPIIEFLYYYDNKEKKKDEKEIQNLKNALDMVIKNNRLNKFRRKKELLEFFNNDGSGEILLKIFTEEQINNFISQNKNKTIIKSKPKISTEIINKLKEVLDYYNNYYLDSKVEEKKELNDIIEKGGQNYDKYLADFETAEKMNIRYPLINIVSKCGKKTLKESIKAWDAYEKIINDKKLNKIPAPIKEGLLEYFNDEENRDRILKIFKSDVYEFFKDKKNHQKKEKKKLSEDVLNNLRSVLTNYKNYLFETNKNEIIFLEKAINNGEEFEYNKYLENLETIKKENDRFPIIEFLFIKDNKDNKERTEKKIKEIKDGFEKIIEKAIKEKKTKRLTKKNDLLEFFINNENRKILLKIFAQDQIDDFISKNEDKISQDNINKLNEVLEYYNNYCPESKSKEISELNDIIKSRKGKFDNYIKEYEKAQKMNIRYPLVYLLFNNEKDAKNNLEKYYNSWEKQENIINRIITNGISKKMTKKIEEELFKYFNDEKNKDILLKIFKQDVYDFFKDEKNHPNIMKKKFEEEVVQKLKIVLNYYKNYFFQSKKEEINLIEKIKSEKDDYKKFLDDLEIAQIKNDKYPIIQYLITSQDNKDIKEKTEEEINQTLNNFEEIEKGTKERNIDNLPYDLEDMVFLLFSYFKNENNKEILLKIFSEDDIKYFIQSEIISDDNINKLNEVLKYYENYFFESNIDKIKDLKEIITNKKGKYKKYLNELKEAIDLNLRYPLINCFIDEKKKKSEKIFKDARECWKKTEEMIKKRNSLKKIGKNKELFFNYLLKDKNNQNILFKIFDKDDLDNLFKLLKEYEQTIKEKQKKNENKNKLKEVLLYYKVFHPDSKKDEINLIENCIKKDYDPKCEEFLKDYDEAIKMNKQSSVVQFLCGTENKTEEKINEKVQLLDTVQNLMKDGKFKKMKKGHKRQILNYMEKEEKGETSTKCFTKEQYDLLKTKS